MLKENSVPFVNVQTIKGIMTAGTKSKALLRRMTDLLVEIEGDRAIHSSVSPSGSH